MNARLILVAAASLVAGLAFAQDTRDIPAGNMHFDARNVDTNGDSMISKNELMKHVEAMWDDMTRGSKSSMSVADASLAFARGNLNFDADSADANRDGRLTKEEFMSHSAAKFDSMKKNPDGMVSVADASKAIGRGNM